MKRVIIVLSLALLLLLYSGSAQAEILGIPDHGPAATVIVPYFEVGIDSVANPHDTLLVVTNICGGSVIVHYEVWDVYGDATGTIYGNFTLTTHDTQPFSMRGLINPAPASTKTQLTDGAFYMGFATFDAVTASTADYPIDATYPFSSSNCLEGFIYYTRLTQGSSNSIAMVPIEATPPGTPWQLQGFYQDDNREEIDADARYSAYNMTRGGGPGSGGTIYEVHSRVYIDPVNNGSTKIVVFTFPEGGWNLGTNFPGPLTFYQYDEAGNVVNSGSVNLNRVVNIIYVGGTQNGWFNIYDIPGGFETYAYSISSASPGFNPALSWDAILESYIWE